MATATATKTTDTLQQIWCKATQNNKNRRLAVKQMAQVLLARDDLLILDTQTTGFISGSEILEVAIITRDGTILLHELLQPTSPNWTPLQNRATQPGKS